MKKLKKDKDIFVIYHRSDADGFGACFSAWLKFKDKANYLGFDYLNGFPLDIKRKTVYLLDISPSLEKLKTFKNNENRIILIDHHLSSLKFKESVDEFIVDINHSAAILTFKYFFKNKKVPKLLSYIEDQDLWRFKLPSSNEINIMIDLLENDFRKWQEYRKKIERKKELQKIIKQGELLIKYRQYLINQIIPQAVLVKFEGYDALAVNSSVLISEVGNALCKKHPPMAIVYSLNGKKKKISLRSDGSVDVSKIAEKYGGGGHKGAASFILPLDKPFPWKKN